MKVSFEKRPGKNWGLYFEGAPDPENLYQEVKQYIRMATSYTDAPDSAIIKSSGAFIQCDCTSFLFVEFWSSAETALLATRAILKRFGLNLLTS